MSMTQRIYTVKSHNSDHTHLVMATSQAQALRHIAGKNYDVEVAKAVDVAVLMKVGVEVEQARGE
jgi:hypothetical protein